VLSDAQMSAVFQACAPLARPDRDAFIAALAALLRTELQPLGDGALFRAIRSLQREFWVPPRIPGSTQHRPASGPAIE
jgi:hypothetical protein